MLSDSEDENQNDEVHKLTINEHYAKAFQYRKEREELDKLKAELGSDISESDLDEGETDSESAESEDEDGEELTPAVDAAILRTLARIRQKDPSIYESGKSVFDEEQEKLASKASFSAPGKNKKKDSVVKNEDDDLLVLREKTKDEQEREEEEYRAYLEREVGDLKGIIGVDEADDEPAVDAAEGDDKKTKKKKQKKAKGAGWTVSRPTKKSPKSPKNRRSLVKTHDADASSGSDSETEDEGSHSDSSFDSLNDAFETSYNFRFEEPGSSTIPSFPRNIPSLVRREDTKRKDARERRKQRKEEEIEKKREEVRRLKALKMREIRRKLEAIGREGGLIADKSNRKDKGKSVSWQDDDFEDEGGEMDNALKELDLEGDWDPEKHDQQMAGLYSGEGEDHWEDAGQVDEDGKPIWNDDIDIGDIQVDDDDEEVVAELSKNDKKKKKKKEKEGRRGKG
ncbi:hypothetical protein NP233_g9583 [Leucocoprinus birnbaumii]|uniref:Kri1-like C-terminal domain-containing protein n=1 Tax=Leucocoprinus birnbaumii TaxID=56174 RepID=A0AAD5YQQ4_9AGAR|nr:hypothetical protein NP233_g9583 [Leucocoprinus birnbaumii]